ncbi:class I SAM-dependent methyltransferase [Lysinibacillus sp. 54212]|uniref:class I SAM-dependent methyltransferase n=1 Tax=Lysinibacillus sp. 54212 TaxID=3119829 RepID=UPI002FCB769F
MLVKTNQDLLQLLDNLLREPTQFWDDFYQDQKKPIPFFKNIPDEHLVSYFEREMIRPTKVLELGCGAGRNAIYLAKKGCSVDGVDLSEQALQWAKERAEKESVNIHFICQDIFDLPLQENSYGLIYDSGCFHHLAPHRRISYLQLVEKLLKPNGYFAICTFEENGPYGGSSITDEEVYIKRSLDGGLGYTAHKLREIFQSFDDIEIRNMAFENLPDDRFGLDGFLIGLFKKSNK